jgi:hypothetical protein
MDKSRTEHHAAQNEVNPRHETAAPEAVTDVITPVPVSVGHSVKTYQQSAQFGIYFTFVIPPGAANATMILPEDPDRLRATLQVNNSSIVLCNSQGAAQAPGNIAAITGNLPTSPAGYVAAKGAGIPSLQNQSALWAVNTDPTTTALVSVCVERVNP